MSESKYGRFLGYKLYKEIDDDNVELIRIIKVKEFNDKFVIKNCETGKTKTINLQELQKYQRLEEKGIIVVTAVWMGTDIVTRTKDIIISVYDRVQVALKDGLPYAICRQGVHDFYYDTIRTDERELVGVCTTQTGCGNIDTFRSLLMCDGIIKSEFINFYMDDNLDDILECLDTSFYDNILFDNYKVALYTGLGITPEAVPDKREYNGWCKDLRILLTENSFITDFDALRNIQAIDCNLLDFLAPEQEKDEVVYEMSGPFCLFMSTTYKLNIVRAQATKFGFDIDMADFNNLSYIFMRDNTNTLYLVVYHQKGEYLEQDLLDQMNQLSPTDKIRLAFYNKYNGFAGESIGDIKS